MAPVFIYLIVAAPGGGGFCSLIRRSDVRVRTRASTCLGWFGEGLEGPENAKNQQFSHSHLFYIQIRPPPNPNSIAVKP